MSTNIDDISIKICVKITNLIEIVSNKTDYLLNKNQQKVPNFNNGERLTVLKNNLLRHCSKFRIEAFNNIKCFNPVKLDMSELNKLKPELIHELFDNASGILDEDFSSAQQKNYDWFTIKRYWLNFFDLISIFLFNFSIKQWLFPLPKTKIEETWDELDALVKEFNFSLKLLLKEENIKKLNASIGVLKEKNNKALIEIPETILHVVLSFLDNADLFKVHRDIGCNRAFKTHTLIPSLKGFDQQVFIYINPALLLLKSDLWKSALKALLQEGYPPILFNTIDPERLLAAPNLGFSNLEEDGLKSSFFPDEHRVVRGTFVTKRPFIGTLNSRGTPVTFYKYAIHRTDQWRICDDDEPNQQGRHLNELKAYEHQKRDGFVPLDNHYHILFEKICTPAHQQTKRSFSEEQFQTWLRLFLGYINASCPGNNNNLQMLSHLTQELNKIVNQPQNSALSNNLGRLMTN